MPFVFYKMRLIYYYKKQPRMVYIDTSKATAAIYLPRNGYAVDGVDDVRLFLKNTVGGQEEEIPIAEAGPYGWTVLLKLRMPEGLQPGEWRYTLKRGADTICRGLAILQEGAPDAPAQYEHETSTIQYNG